MKTSKITLLYATTLALLLLGTVAFNMVSAPWGWTRLSVWWSPQSYTLDNPVPDPWEAVLSYWGFGFGAAWTTPTEVYDRCGEDSGHPASAAIDGSTWTYWQHSTTENHWITFDMGETKDIAKIRIYQSWSYSYRWGGYDGIEVYVSDDPENWGPAVWTGTLWGYYGWLESGTFSAEGRYVKLVSRSTSSSQRLYEVQMQGPQGIDPSTILLEGSYAPESEPYRMWWGFMLVVPFDGYDVLTALLLKGGHLSPGRNVIYLEITAQLYDGTSIQGSGRITLTVPEAPPP